LENSSKNLNKSETIFAGNGGPHRKVAFKHSGLQTQQNAQIMLYGVLFISTVRLFYFKMFCTFAKIRNVISVKRFIFFGLCLFFPSLIQSQTNDSLQNLQVSLLTVMPRSNAVYTIYGHTALRLCDPVRSIDVVLNWGTFDSDKPNFIYHFLRGETDYSMSDVPTPYFIYSYKSENSKVIEQILNIPDSLKASFLQAMETNLQSDNREYRYNIFFDNCTTRPRDIIEKLCGGKLIYPIQNDSLTLRELVHDCTKYYPWMEFGIDLLIGNGADSLIALRTEMFLPEKLMNHLDRSIVKTSDGKEYPIVLSSKTILQAENNGKAKAGSPFTKPIVVTVFVLIIYFTLAVIAYWKKHNFRLPFALLFLPVGLAGCIVAGLVFFSQHPCTSPNWNLLWIHPLQLIGFAGFLFKKYYTLFRWYHAVNFVLLSCFLLCWHWIPQEMNFAFIPLIGCLWLVSGCQLFVFEKKKC
jgi:hypothetical protein